MILTGNEIWNINEDGIDILIDFKNTATAKEFMANSDFTYNIMIDDLEVAIDETYTEVNNTYPNMPWLEREGISEKLKKLLKIKVKTITTIFHRYDNGLETIP